MCRTESLCEGTFAIPFDVSVAHTHIQRRFLKNELVNPQLPSYISVSEWSFDSKCVLFFFYYRNKSTVAWSHAAQHWFLHDARRNTSNSTSSVPHSRLHSTRWSVATVPTNGSHEAQFVRESRPARPARVPDGPTDAEIIPHVKQT